MSAPSSAARCDHCGTPFTSLNPRGRRRQFCNATCRSAARRQRARTLGAAGQQPFAVAFQAAVEQGGLTLRQLAGQLERDGCSLSTGTLSQWQNGRTTPWPTTDTYNRLLAIERCLSLAPAHLITALEQTRRSPSRPSRPWPAAVRHQNQSRSGLSVRSLTLDQRKRHLERRIVQDSGIDRRLLILTAQREHFAVGPLRWPLESRIELEACALRDGIDRYWYICTYESQCPPDVEALDGCNRGHTLSEDLLDSEAVGPRLIATPLCFMPLRQGDTVTFSFRVTYEHGEHDTDLPEKRFCRMLTSPACRELELTLRFDECQQPIDLSECRWSPTGPERPTRASAIPLARRAKAYYIKEPDPEPLGYGWTWDWPGHEQAAPPPPPRRTAGPRVPERVPLALPGRAWVGDDPGRCPG